MTYTLDDLADYLATQAVGVVGTDIYKSGFYDGGTPAAPDTQVALYEYPGFPPEQVLGASNVSPILYPRVQVMTRALKYSDARAKAQAVYAVLANITDVTINGTKYLRVEALAEPGFAGNDQNSRPLISTNYQVWRAP